MKATEVKVRTAEVTLTTVRLSRAVLKQMPELGYEEMKPLLMSGSTGPEEQLKAGAVVGWVHGSVLGDEWKRWLIINTGEGTYGRYDAMQGLANRYPQLYVV